MIRQNSWGALNRKPESLAVSVRRLAPCRELLVRELGNHESEMGEDQGGEDEELVELVVYATIAPP